MVKVQAPAFPSGRPASLQSWYRRSPAAHAPRSSSGPASRLEALAGRGYRVEDVQLPRGPGEADGLGASGRAALRVSGGVDGVAKGELGAAVSSRGQAGAAVGGVGPEVLPVAEEEGLHRAARAAGVGGQDDV